MNAWPTVALRNIAAIERDIIDASAIEDGTLYVGLENIKAGGKFLKVKPVNLGELASSKFAFTPRHLLYGKLRPYLAKIARPDFAGICSTDILPVLPGPQVDRNYLVHFLLTPNMVALANSRATGANLPRISPNSLAELKIPLPPLPEQRRIAEILDRADELRPKRRAAIAQLDSLMQSIFLDMFGDPAINPRKWSAEPFGELVEEFRYGTSKKSANEGRPALRIPNIVGGAIDLCDLKFVPVETAEFKRLQLHDGDLLFVRTNGNPDFVGRCAVFDSIAVSACKLDPSEFIFASYLIRARLAASEVTSSFLREYLSSSEGRRQLRSRCKTSAGQYNINTESLGAIHVPLPPIELQREFSRRVAGIEKLKTSHRASLAELDTLFASLQHRAFKGEL